MVRTRDFSLALCAAFLLVFQACLLSERGLLCQYMLLALSVFPAANATPTSRGHLLPDQTMGPRVLALKKPYLLLWVHAMP